MAQEIVTAKFNVSLLQVLRIWKTKKRFYKVIATIISVHQGKAPNKSAVLFQTSTIRFVPEFKTPAEDTIVPLEAIIGHNSRTDCVRASM